MKKGIEFIHGAKYGKAMKMARKFTANNVNRPILTFVNHDKDGSIVATDSYGALRVKNIHGFKENYLVHPHTLEFAKGKFPDTDDIIDDLKGTPTIRLNQQQIKIWLQMHKSLNQFIRNIYGTNYHVTLEFSEDITFKIAGENEMSFKLPFEDYKQPEKVGKVSYDQSLMRDALDAHFIMESESIDIVIKGSHSPILLDNGIDVQTIVTPKRVY